MKLYKYRTLNNIEYVVDIFRNQRLYCSTVDELNDPFEGMYLRTPPKGVLQKKYYDFSKYIGPTLSRISDPFDSTTCKRICSLSSNPTDVRMWSHYADGHKGILIEVEIDETEQTLHKVDYFDQLKTTNHTILTPLNLTNILTRKSFHWESEKEYRIITESRYFDVTNRISAVWLGLRTPPLLQDLIRSLCSVGTKIYSTKLDGQSIKVTLDKDVTSEGSNFTQF